MTTAFGQFLEYSLPTPDIRASLEFYRGLGFTEIPVGDIRDYHYAVISDGRIALGLHGAGFQEPALSFVKNDVAVSMDSLEIHEDTISFMRLGAESFHEIGVQSPDGHLVVMMEARTFSRADLTELALPVIGQISEISLGCRDLDAEHRFWSKAGFIAGEEADEEAFDQVLELLAPGLCLGLRTEVPAGRSVLRLIAGDEPDVVAALERLEIPIRRSAGMISIDAPEGTRIQIVTT